MTTMIDRPTSPTSGRRTLMSSMTKVPNALSRWRSSEMMTIRMRGEKYRGRPSSGATHAAASYTPPTRCISRIDGGGKIRGRLRRSSETYWSACSNSLAPFSRYVNAPPFQDHHFAKSGIVLRVSVVVGCSHTFYRSWWVGILVMYANGRASFWKVTSDVSYDSIVHRRAG